ncbi:hypothetical protein [Marinobacter daepoensis]|uniref:hypothetical protein n=1 Tax=Marinobacter daepoensis TaxID=262077 RepID=UPI0004A25643|nr:hypothetical protein [Marinobacter daepoensis]
MLKTTQPTADQSTHCPALRGRPTDNGSSHRSAVPGAIQEPDTLYLIRPADRLRMLVEHGSLFGLEPVFTTADLKPWFTDMSDAAMRVMVNRQCAKADVILSVCHGVYQSARLSWNSHQILIAAARKLRGTTNFYLTMHGVQPAPFRADKRTFLVCLTSGRDAVLKSRQHGIIVLKHTALPIGELRSLLTWDESLRCLKAPDALATTDYLRHRSGLKSMLKNAGLGEDFPELMQNSGH